MSQQTTDHTTLDDQRPAIAAMFTLAWVAPHLPAPYIAITPGEGNIHLSIGAASDFEAWREVLQIDPLTVTLRGHHGSAWLNAQTRYNDALLEIATSGVPLSEELADAQQDAEPDAAVSV